MNYDEQLKEIERHLRKARKYERLAYILAGTTIGFSIMTVILSILSALHII